MASAFETYGVIIVVVIMGCNFLFHLFSFLLFQLKENMETYTQDGVAACCGSVHIAGVAGRSDEGSL